MSHTGTDNYGMHPYFNSTNQNNNGPEDPVYTRERIDRFTSKYWVPTASKLSRGKKGIIQRIFTGEPFNNLCNVYVYNETSKLWYHEDTILGNSTRRYPSVSYPPETMMSSSRTLSDGITYTATTSTFSGGRAFPWFAFGDTYEVHNSYYQITHVYPTNNNQGQPIGTYTGSTSLGGVSGEWLKLQTSTAIQPNSFKIITGNVWSSTKPRAEQIPKEWTILGSNNNTSWTNLGNFTIPSGWAHGDDLTGNLTISTSYTYFAVVLKRRNATSGGMNLSIMVPNFTFILDRTSEDFGRSLDGTDNADMVAVGAPGTWFGSVSNINGYAYVFTKDSTGNGWTQRGSVVSQQGGFGHSVALSQKDGNILAVGAPFYNTLVPNTGGNIDFNSIPVSEGKVYIYKWNGSNYTLQQTLNSPSGTLSTSTPATWKNFYFGYSLGITNVGHKIIVGEPSIRSVWSVSHQLQGGFSLSDDSFQYTGNAHVYDNVTVLSGGTTWTSNVSMTSVIDTTGIGLTNDTHPKKVRWLDALGTSVDVNRAGTRILAGAPGSYGTSNASPQVMSGRIYTLDWDQTNAEWKEMGQDPKHITAPQANMLLGWYTRFGGSGKRIIAGAPGYDSKGSVVTFDYDGYKWVNFPNETVEIETWINGTSQHRLGESISVDGESEMISIGKDEHQRSEGSGPSRPNSFSVPAITYIGGATTTVAGSNGQISTGMSNVWVYNISQSMVIKGNATFDGNLQTSGISVGTNDQSSDGNKSIYIGGSQSENAYEMSVIENRVYESDEKTELLIFKGGDNANASGGGTLGPDRIRLKGGQIAFDLNTGSDRTLEDIRAVMHRNTGGAGMLGMNVTSPTEVIHVDGKIKSTQGFIGRGREITGLNFDYINNTSDVRFSQAGATKSPTTWGDIITNAKIAFPTLALTSNSVSGYTVTASRDVTNAWKAFDDDTTRDVDWTLGDDDNITYSIEADPGSYIGTSERIAGYKGEWIELQIPDPIFLTQLDIHCLDKRCQPRIASVFGSNDGIEYNLIHYTGDLGYLSFANNGNNTIFTRIPDYNNDEPYDRILIITTMISGGTTFINWENIDIYGKTYTFTPNLKIDNSGKIGIGNTNPQHPLDVTGNINLTGQLLIGGVAQTFGSTAWSTSGTDIYASSAKVSVGTSDFPHLVNIVGSSVTYADLLIANDNPLWNARLLLGTPSVSNLNNAAFKAAIIAAGTNTNSASDLHFCLNNSTSNGPSGTATLSDSKMVIANHTSAGGTSYVGNVGIGLTPGNSPLHKLHVVGDIGLTGSLKEITTGNDWLPSITTGGGIINDNGSLKIDLAAQGMANSLAMAQGGTGNDGSTNDDNGLMYYDNTNAELTSLAPPAVDDTILLTTTANGLPSWGLLGHGMSVTTGSGPGPTSTLNLDLDTTSGGLGFTSGNKLQVSLDASGGLGYTSGNKLRIDFTNTSSIVGQLPASFVVGGGGGSGSSSQWSYSSTTSPPELTFDSNGSGDIVAIGGWTDYNNILTIRGSVKIDQGSNNLPGYGSNGDLYVHGNATVNGWLSKPSGSFKIDHPLPSMSNTHSLYHSFIEGPKADLIYRGKVNLVNGSASINLDTVSNMTSGTFEALNRDVQCFTTNESDWDAVKGSVSGNTLTISCQNASSTANVSWLVIGERKDKYMLDTPWTDDDGHFIPEKAKST